MADQGNFKPAYNYTFSSFDSSSLNAQSLGVPSEDNQPMFPLDYRQYFGNPVFPPAANAQENFTFDRAHSDGVVLNFSTQNYSNQAKEQTDSVRRENVENSDLYQYLSKNVQIVSDKSKTSVASGDSGPVVKSEKILGDDVARGYHLENKETRIEKTKIKVEPGKVNDVTELLDFTNIKKEHENDQTGKHEDQGSKGTESVVENLEKTEEAGTDDENVDEEQEDEDNTSVVSDASTIIEDEENIVEQLKKKGKTPKVKFEQNKNSRKKPRKQTLPKPVKPADKKEYTCETCGKVVQSLRALTKHKNLHTDKYKCEECGKIFNSEVSLKNHHKVHSGFVGNEVCNVCDKTFYDRSSLNKHTLSVHMGIKNFQCEYCSMSFFARKTYEEHVRVHTGERPFKCTQCPKSYKRISDLNHHLRLHKGEVSHTCEKCGEGFRRVSELNRHMTKHSGETVMPVMKTKRCTWCGLTFATTKALNKHFNTHMESLGSSKIDVPNPIQFEHKLKLVDEIVQDLGTNLIGPEVSSIVSKEKFLPNAPDIAKDFNFPAEPRFNMNVFPYQGIDMTYRNMTGEQFPRKECEMSTSSLPARIIETTKVLKPNSENVSSTRNINRLPVADLGQSKDKVTDYMNEEEKQDAQMKEKKDAEVDLGEEKATASGLDFIESNDCSNENTVNDVKPEIYFKMDDENENDDYGVETNENDEYGGETDVEDYEYVMNSSPVDKEAFQKKIDNIIDAKVEFEVGEYDDDKDEKYIDPKDDVTKDPDFIPSGERISKRKATVPRKNVLNMKKVTKGREAGDGKIIGNDRDSNNKKKKRANTETKQINEDASMDLEALKCLQCGKFFAKKVSLIKHMNLHRGTYSCEVCGKCFSTKRSLEIHTDNHEGRKVNTAMCNVCDKAFYDASSLNKHVKTVHMDYKPFPCTMCDRRFSENKTLVEHLRVHTGERPFACEICGKTYKRASELNFHLRKHNGEVNLNCPECGKGFMRMGQLRQHMLLKHDKERPFSCFLCAKTFPTRIMLKDHRKVHITQRKHVCERCGYKFHTKYKLEKHLKRKTDCQALIYKNMNGLFVCRFCYGEFNTVEERKAHINEVHHDDATYPCEVCGKRFRRSQALKIHLKIHYQVRDYKCTMCSAAFIQRHHLVQHIATHTGSRPYQCNICLKKFAHNATLYNHMKHH